jgi:hypothetical protein
MTDMKDLRPATQDELVQTLSHALRYGGKKRVHYADEMMASLMAQHLAAYLDQSLFVVMKKPPLKGNDNPGHKWPAKAP